MRPQISLLTEPKCMPHQLAGNTPELKKQGLFVSKLQNNITADSWSHWTLESLIQFVEKLNSTDMWESCSLITYLHQGYGFKFVGTWNNFLGNGFNFSETDLLTYVMNRNNIKVIKISTGEGKGKPIKCRFKTNRVYNSNFELQVGLV